MHSVQLFPDFGLKIQIKDEGLEIETKKHIVDIRVQRFDVNAWAMWSPAVERQLWKLLPLLACR